jgi:tetratricopeptide (TPR) repeat protein
LIYINEADGAVKYLCIIKTDFKSITMKTIPMIILLIMQTVFSFGHDITCTYIESGNRAFQQNNFHEAIIQYSMALQLDSTLYNVRYARGMAFYASEEFLSASADFTRCITLNSTDKNVWLQCGLSRVALHDYIGALEDFEKCHDLDPFDENIYQFIENCRVMVHAF